MSLVKEQGKVAGTKRIKLDSVTNKNYYAKKKRENELKKGHEDEQKKVQEEKAAKAREKQQNKEHEKERKKHEKERKKHEKERNGPGGRGGNRFNVSRRTLRSILEKTTETKRAVCRLFVISNLSSK
jgi:septal ring factor EnvC (AmiA/AmiB activator)